MSEVQRTQTVALPGENLSEKQISATIGFNKTAVHQAIAKYGEEGSFTDKKRTGRPHITTIGEDNLIRRIVMRSPASSNEEN